MQSSGALDPDFKELPPAEVGLRRRVLDELRSRDAGGSMRVGASDFQSCLRALGLSFGNEVVDRIMVECDIHPSGVVDFRGFASAVRTYDAQLALKRELEQAAVVASSPTAPLDGPGTPAGSERIATRGAEFREALEEVSGGVGGGGGGGGGVVGQGALVRRLSRQLSGVFERFDGGHLTTDVFREELRRLGLRETTELSRLLRSRGRFGFADLYRALTAEDDPAVASGKAAGEKSGRLTGIAPVLRGDVGVGGSSGDGTGEVDFVGKAGHGRRLGPREGERSVVGWEGGDGTTSGTTGGRGDIVSWRGSVAEEIAKHRGASHMGPGKRGDAAAKVRELQRGADVALALRDAADATPDSSRFETSTQATARLGVGMTSQGPITSAGYGGRDGGLLREQLYSLVRQLDAGSLSTIGFRSRLSQLGVSPGEIPSLDRLLGDFEANGTADFAKFVRAFEDLLAARVPAPPTAPTGRDGAFVTTDPSTAPSTTPSDSHPPFSSPGGRRAGVPLPDSAIRGHGDIVGWRGDAGVVGVEEERENARRLGIRPRSARAQALYTQSTTPSVRDAIFWEQAAASSPSNAPPKVSRRAPGVYHSSPPSAHPTHPTHPTHPPTHPTSSSSIIAWDTEGRGDGRGGGSAVGGHAPPTADGLLFADGTSAGRGKAPTSSPLALHDRYGTRGLPFGTDADVPSLRKG